MTNLGKEGDENVREQSRRRGTDQTVLKATRTRVDRRAMKDLP